jgi:hypothetical protein
VRTMLSLALSIPLFQRSHFSPSQVNLLCF